ncbi:hypothetical protein [Burkholderia catarinensis]|uniref:hypothetical protein n=1 Tax=Burkholderia catarinensis TaxID=1108140 RepID=UPI000917A1FF|nr:hypothetical protein [Burkholderia catarinensis]KAG8151685.1 hypothetical protein BFF94_021050 [Burkholderia catarinensis]
MKERPILFSGTMVRAILEGRKTQTRRVVTVRGEQPPAWATFASEGHSPTYTKWSKPTGLFYWSESDDAPTKELRRWPILPPSHAMAGDHYWTPCPHGKPGDRLWVRETHAQVFEVDIPSGRPTGPTGTAGSPARPDWKSRYVYCADGPMPNVQWHHIGDSQPVRWTPSIHMPRRASRITLEITGVRVERMQSISEADAIAEGAVYTDFGIEPPKGSLSLDGGRTFHPVVRSTQRNGWHMGDATSHKRCMGSAKYAFANLINRLHGGENWNLKGPGLWEANPWVWVIEFRRVEQ